MKRDGLYKISLLLIIVLITQSCASDIRTKLIKKEGITRLNTNKGKQLLEEAWEKQGLDKLSSHKSYKFKGIDTWRGFIGKKVKLWPEAKTEISFKYRIGTFDGQLEYLSGERKGYKAGLQNWNYYEIRPSGNIAFIKADPPVKFGLAAFQYFVEMLDRLKQTPIISYAGERNFRGKTYDMVFCTWNKAEPHAEADQYVVWINKETGLMELTQYTVRDNFNKTPGGKMAYGCVEYTDFRNINGILIPHVQTIYSFQPKEKQENFLHQLILSDFSFDSFPLKELTPNPQLPVGGDFK